MTSIITTIALLLAGLPPSAGSYLSLRQASVAEYRIGHYTNAEKLIHIALDLAETAKNDYAIALGHSVLGDIRQAERRFPEAEEEYSKVIALLSGHPERNHALAIVWRNLGGALTAEGRYAESFSALKECSKLVDKGKFDDPQLKTQLLNSLGVIYYLQGKIGKAESSFRQATELHFTTNNSNNPNNSLDVDPWEILNNLGRVYQLERKYEKAEDVYKQSLQLAEARLGRSDPTLTVELDNLGSLYTRIGRYQEAEPEFQRSVAILEQAKKPFDEMFQMRTFYGLAETYLGEGDETRAQPVLARAADIARRRVQRLEMPEVLEVLDTYAKVLKDQSDSVEAQRLEGEAQRIRASLALTVPVTRAK